MIFEYPITRILEQLTESDLLPTIIFRSARKQCDNDLVNIGFADEFLLPRETSEKLMAHVERIAARLQIDLDLLKSNVQFNTLVNFGIGAHHAGQLLVWRLLLEELMSAGLLRVMIATGTVAAGVDFPARSVVVTAHSRRGEEGFQNFTSAEFQQMSGRAGRRGKDTVGFCFIAPSKYADARVVAEIIKRPPEPLRSAYFASPSTVLNLMKYRTEEELRYLVSKSLASFKDAKTADEIIKEAESLEKDPSADYKRKKKIRKDKNKAEKMKTQQIGVLNLTLMGLEDLKFVEAGKLTEKGVWAAELCSSLVLHLAEAIDEHLFYDISHKELVGLVASISGDAHRNYLSITKNAIPKEKYRRMDKIVEKIENIYDGAPFHQEIRVNPAASNTVLAWMEADSWLAFSGLLKLAGVSDGDAARLISQTADQLNQISRLTETHPELAKNAEEARSFLLRPPITDFTAVAP